MTKPQVSDLWQESEGDPARFRALMAEHGYPIRAHEEDFWLSLLPPLPAAPGEAGHKRRPPCRCSLIPEAPDVQVSVMSGQEAGLRRLRQTALAEGEAATEYAQLDANGVFLVWDSGREAEARFPLAKRIRIARASGGIIFRRRVIVVEDWEEVAEP